MIWSNFLHFYQPPTQKQYWVDRVTNECYRRIVTELLNNPEAKLTLNVNAVLCDLWSQYGHQDVIDGLKILVQRGQVELVGSAKFHPLLPKISKEEITRQVHLNEEGLFKYFGVLPPTSRHSGLDPESSKSDQSELLDSGSGAGMTSKTAPRLRGFFPPEMAYDRYVAEVVASLGYEWIIAEELSYSQHLGQVKYDRIYNVSDVGSLQIFFRDRNFSYHVLSGQLGTPALFLQALGERRNDGSYLLTAMDGETFGHHRPGMEKLLFEIYKDPEIKSVTISELPTLYPKRESTPTFPSTWALMEKDIPRGVPFNRWDEPTNEIHQLQWELTRLATSVIPAPEPESSKQITNNKKQSAGVTGFRVKPGMTSRELLDRALHSDQYWWASATPWWSLEMIERGAMELLATVKAAKEEGLCGQDKVDEAQDLYYRILTTGFAWQRSGKVDEMSKAEDEAVRMSTDQGLPSIPGSELDKMIATIKVELNSVVAHEEYERAIQLRDRIKELEGYRK
ncbi:MAG: UvrB/UvrC motif-containing protein [candidate division WWE3 bacterium]|nr:UvrB/UvrC motif-containing protein [candidate division WWE3 bacterium]